MKTWYMAICDIHGEGIDIFVTNPLCTAAYLGDYNTEIGEWLELHQVCEPRLIGNDIQFEKLYDAGWLQVGDVGGLGRIMRP